MKRDLAEYTFCLVPMLDVVAAIEQSWHRVQDRGDAASCCPLCYS